MSLDAVRRSEGFGAATSGYHRAGRKATYQGTGSEKGRKSSVSAAFVSTAGISTRCNDRACFAAAEDNENKITYGGMRSEGLLQTKIQ